MRPYACAFVRRDAFAGSSLSCASRPRRSVPRSLWTRSLSRILLKMKSFLLILFEMAWGIRVAHLRAHARHAPACAFVPCVCVRLRTRTCTRVLTTPPHAHLHCASATHPHCASTRIRATHPHTHPHTHPRYASALRILTRIRTADSRVSCETRYDARETEANPRLIERGGYDADRRDLRHARKA